MDEEVGRRDQPQPESAAQLLVTVLGDYWFDSDEHIASSALVAVLREIGVGEDAARAALSRLCRDGRLERTKDGRRTAYRLAPSARETASLRGRELMRFGSEPIGWDGQWTCVAFTVPESERRLRSVLRSRLRALRMGSLFDGFWISPHPILRRVDDALTDVDLDGVALFRATEVPRPSGVDLTSAWDLPAARARIDVFAASVGAVRLRFDDGVLGPAEALVVRTELMARWRELARQDPGLPDSLLPTDWPLRSARDGFLAVYDGLGPLGELRVRQLAGIGADEPAGPRFHSLSHEE